MKNYYKELKFSPFKVRKGAKVKAVSTDVFDYEILSAPVKFAGKKVIKDRKPYFAVTLLRSFKGKNKFEILEAEYVLGATTRNMAVKRYERAALKDYRMRTRGF